jgi:hypothetical protein
MVRIRIPIRRFSRVNVAVEESLLPAGGCDPVDGLAGVGEPEREQVALGALTGQVDPGFAEVDLRVHPGLIVPDHESRDRCRPGRLGNLLPPPVDLVPHGRVRDLRPEFLLKPGQDPLNGVPLLRRSLQVRPATTGRSSS